MREVTISLQKILGIGRNNGAQINKEGEKLLGKGCSKIPFLDALASLKTMFKIK